MRRPDRPVAVTAAWEDCLAAPDWAGDPVWIHGDLMPGNLLVRDRRLSAVIDWGALGVGDPAPDLAPAWSTLPASVRDEFRQAVGYDDDTWRRGRGWALGPALTGIPYYWDTVPAFAQRGLRTIAAVLADLGCARSLAGDHRRDVVGHVRRLFPRRPHVAGRRRPVRHHDRRQFDLGVRDRGEQVRHHVQPGPPS